MKKMISRSCARRTAAALAAAIAVSLAPAGWCAAAPASSYTAAANQRVYHQLDFSDEQERKFAEKGLIEAPQALEIKDANGRVVWSQAAYDFLKNKAPDTANPSLWRNAQNNHVCGLFEVMDGIYQVRGYDMSNITFVRGDTGWIVFDPLMTVECSQAAKALVEKHFGKRPVKAVIYSHSHVDHYGGVRGVVSEADKVPIIAPEGFEEHAVSENVYAGAAMGRRASYQYGTLLDPGPEGRRGARWQQVVALFDGIPKPLWRQGTGGLSGA
jgi:alkyl sulfatase BDS1-like metallo-beta-lactamase superfamily hydrolase